ncbi:MAG: peptidoglycan-binding protein [SAR324 cluster bacterium]|nr:peptidoglycan-binding protein [SAR324 cluster bacterium]
MKVVIYLTSLLVFIGLVTWLVVYAVSKKPGRSKRITSTSVSRKETEKPRAKNIVTVDRIKLIQMTLNHRGANLVITSKLDKETKKALREFQKKNKLEVTGLADFATLSKLGIATNQ